MTFGISFLAISEPFHAGYMLAGIDRWYAFLSDARAILRWIYPSWYFVSFSCHFFSIGVHIIKNHDRRIGRVGITELTSDTGEKHFFLCMVCNIWSEAM